MKKRKHYRRSRNVYLVIYLMHDNGLINKVLSVGTEIYIIYVIFML